MAANGAANAGMGSNYKETPNSGVSVVNLLNMQNVKLNKRIADSVSGIDSEALAGLTGDIIKHNGCHSPAHVWRDPADDTLYLIDGFVKINVCLENGLPLPEGQLIDGLSDLDTAIQWRIDHHLNRRNLNSFWAAYLRGVRYNSEKRPAHRPHGVTEMGKSDTELPQTEGETAQRLAETLGVSKATIERNANFAKAIDIIATEIGLEFSRGLLNRKYKLSTKDICALAKKDNKAAIAAKLESDPKLSLSKAEASLQPSPTPSGTVEEETSKAEDSNNLDEKLNSIRNRQLELWASLRGVDIEAVKPEYILNIIETTEAIKNTADDILKKLKNTQIALGLGQLFKKYDEANQNESKSDYSNASSEAPA